MSPGDFQLLAGSLEPMTLDKGLVLAEPGVPARDVVFPESGLVSVVAKSPNGRQIEVGVFGLDGMGSTAVALGVDQTPHQTYVQMTGHAHRLPAAVLRSAMAQSATMRELLLRYVQSFLVHVAETAVANGINTVEQRLARWLLIVHDRVQHDDLAITHEFLSLMLGVRRTGVTLALHVLEGGGMIRSTRGLVTVLDRAKLKQTARDCYGSAQAEYDRLFGPLR